MIDDKKIKLYTKDAFVFAGLITPTTSSFTITLTTSPTELINYYSGITNVFSPTISLTNNTNQQFNATYNSTQWNITNCYLQILYLNNTILNSTTFTNCNTASGNGSITQYTNNYTYLQLVSIYTINSTNTTTNTSYLQNISYKTTYSIHYYYEGDYSLMKAIRHTKEFNNSGFGDAERIMIVFIIIFSITIAAARKSINRYINSGTILILIALLVITASFLDLMHLNFINGDSLIANVMNQWGIAILIGILTIFTVIFNREEER